ncbi:MAG: 2-C-methyl-D-erythritol 4-phosphate cytidylyltransferase [Oscillospiraceae bacterium]|jgi:2-C-methyl-D-erythritol 4-phosphate cytidylyltransferase|nr:2-C-methyl-D-erythritol 4-phosphate cytidylyltransferase [Oscillospiraceae bacterium]
MPFGKRKKPRPPVRPYCAAVVPAAGQALRMGGGGKIFTQLCGEPLVAYTLTALDACPDIDEIVLSARPDDIIPLGDLCRQYSFAKVTHIVRGGDTRTASVYAGLMAISPKAELAAVHDAARPLVTPALISEAVRLAARYGAVAPAVPSKDTVKEIQRDHVLSTPPRESLALIQTPQVFNAGLLKAALVSALREDWAVSDDCGAVERMGMTVWLSPGSYENLKVTTPDDLILAEALLRQRLDMKK